MRIIYQSRNRDIEYEQYLLNEFGGNSLIFCQNTVYPNFSNIKFGEDKEAILVLFEKVKPIIRSFGDDIVCCSKYVMSSARRLEGNSYSLIIRGEYIPGRYSTFEHNDTYFPKITCLCFNDGDHVMAENAIGSFLSQDYAGDMDFILFNHGDIAMHLGSYDKNENKRLRIIRKSKKDLGYGELLNYALSEINGEYVVFWDTSGFYDSGFIRNAISNILLSRKYVYIEKNYNRLKNKRLYLATNGNENTAVFRDFLVNSNSDMSDDFLKQMLANISEDKMYIEEDVVSFVRSYNYGNGRRVRGKNTHLYPSNYSLKDFIEYGKE